jgi:hypothetical protein
MPPRHRQQFVVEVVARVVQVARAQSVPGGAVVAVAVAEENVAARLVLQEVGEVFRAHGRLGIGVDLLGAHQRHHHLGGESGFGGVVDQRRIIAGEPEIDRGAEGRRRVFRDRRHALLDHVEHADVEGAHRAGDFRLVGDDVGGAAGVDLRDRQHRTVVRIGVARNDGLPGLDDLDGDHHRVDALVRLGRVRTLAQHGEIELVGRGHQRPRTQAETARRHAGPVVDAEDGVHRALFEQAVLDHAFGAAAALFGRLENQVHGAVEIALARKVEGRAQQHRGVAVVAAGVHLSFVGRRMGEGVDFLHRQGVHVGAQADRAFSGARLDDADHAGDAHAADDRDAPFGELGGDHVGGALLFVAEFGMGVDVAPDLPQFGFEFGDRFKICVENGFKRFHDGLHRER